MDKERFEKQISFILETDKEKNILRQTHVTGYGRRENDAEHAWHMAIMVYLLKEYSNQEFDLAKAMMMALIHDVVEIDAGDTYAYEPERLKTQKEREEKAAERIFGLLPKDQEEHLRELFYEYELGQSAEAKIVRVMDNFQPLLLNNYNGGKDWITHGINKTQVTNRQKTSEPGSREIWEYTKKLIDENVEKGSIKKD